MDTIWKFKLKLLTSQLVEMPFGSLLLYIDVQDGVPCLWARVDPEQAMVRRRLITHGTGHPVPESSGDHVGSYMLNDGTLVLHVFESV